MAKGTKKLTPSKQKSQKSKSVSVNTDLFLNVINPNLLFNVQRAFQSQGITFVNLSNGRFIYGNVNTDTLGMVRSSPGVKETTHNFGFPVNHTGQFTPKPKQVIVNVEATLNIYEPPKKTDPVVFTVRVVNKADLEYWYSLSQNIGLGFLKLVRGKPKPLAVFNIVPLTSPDEADPNSSISTMLELIQGYTTSPSGNVHAVSNTRLTPKR